MDEFSKSGFVAVFGVPTEQLGVFVHRHSLYNIRRRENPTGNKFRRAFSVAAARMAAATPINTCGVRAGQVRRLPYLRQNRYGLRDKAAAQGLRRFAALA